MSTEIPHTSITMRFLLLLAAVICVASAQRPFYAGKTNRHQQVLPQYLEEREKAARQKATTATSPASGVSKDNNDNESERMVKLVETWPEEKRPFWYLNMKKIEEDLGSNKNNPTYRPYYTG